jgi:hypothetical protein
MVMKCYEKTGAEVSYKMDFKVNDDKTTEFIEINIVINCKESYLAKKLHCAAKKLVAVEFAALQAMKKALIAYVNDRSRIQSRLWYYS